MAKKSPPPSHQRTYETHDISILDHISDWISIVDSDYVYCAVSRGYSERFGKLQSEIIGSTCVDIIGEDLFFHSLKQPLDLALSGQATEYQFCCTNLEGARLHIQSKLTPYYGPFVKNRGVVIVARDVTELVETAERLERERSLLNNIVNTLPDLIFAKDSEGVYQVANRSFAEFLDKPSDEIVGKTDNELMSSVSANYIQSMDSQVVTTGNPVRVDEWVTYADGRRRLLDMNKLPLTSEANGTVGVLGIGTNVTFEKKAEQHREMASVFFDVTTNPCFILDANAQILRVNEAAQSHFGLQGLNNSHLFEWLSVPSSTKTDLSSLMAGKGYWHGEVCDDEQALIAAIHKVAGQSLSEDRYILIIQDLKTQNGVTVDLLSKAYQDPLTTLPNRRMFLSKFESALIRAERQLKKIAVLYIDLNGFKPINDLFGHQVGDYVLKVVAQQLSSCFLQKDTLARIGGDEFAGIVTVDTKAEAEKFMGVLHTALSRSSLPAQLDGRNISASIGVSYFPEDGDSVDVLLNRADEAMYGVKRGRKLG